MRRLDSIECEMTLGIFIGMFRRFSSVVCAWGKVNRKSVGVIVLAFISPATSYYLPIVLIASEGAGQQCLCVYTYE